jgi:hypothetical protein
MRHVLSGVAEKSINELSRIDGSRFLQKRRTKPSYGLRNIDFLSTVESVD